MTEFLQTLKDRHAEAAKTVEEIEGQKRQVDARLTEARLTVEAYRVAVEREESRGRKPGRKTGKRNIPAARPASDSSDSSSSDSGGSKTELIMAAITTAGGAGVTVGDLVDRLKN